MRLNLLLFPSSPLETEIGILKGKNSCEVFLALKLNNYIFLHVRLEIHKPLYLGSSIDLFFTNLTAPKKNPFLHSVFKEYSHVIAKGHFLIFKKYQQFYSWKEKPKT